LGLSSKTDAAGTTYVTRDSDGRVINERSGTNTRRYYAFDGLGSTVSLTDTAGTETSSYSYDPFGNRVGGAWNAEAMFQFAGGYRMANGLYHFGQRYYDPVIGRFTQQDPLDRVGDLRQGNRYLYAGDDPINLIDPTGTRNCTSIAFTGQIKCSDGAASNKKALERTCFVVGVLSLRFVWPVYLVSRAWGTAGGQRSKATNEWSMSSRIGSAIAALTFSFCTVVLFDLGDNTSTRIVILAGLAVVGYVIAEWGVQRSGRSRR
jgi:RHS repeat-associated protein